VLKNATLLYLPNPRWSDKIAWMPSHCQETLDTHLPSDTESKSFVQISVPLLAGPLDMISSLSYDLSSVRFRTSSKYSTDSSRMTSPLGFRYRSCQQIKPSRRQHFHPFFTGSSGGTQKRCFSQYQHRHISRASPPTL